MQPAVTQLLSRLRDGDAAASDQLLPLVYDELQNLARAVFSGENHAHTLQPTALVHEAWMRLCGNLGTVEDRRHFFVIAGRAMRRVLTDHARRRKAQKRGDGRQRLTLDTALGPSSASAPASASGSTAVDLVDLNDVLERLAEHNARLAEVAELRLFGGLSIDETAEALGLSPRSVDSDWAMAKAWLQRELKGDG